MKPLARAGKGSAWVINRVRLMFKAGERWLAPRVARAPDVSQGTVFHVQRRFAEWNWMRH
ncbi:MAG: hypothetical protein OXN21_00015 [Chloroflexota bacterium]|nr:hypothetical protein [Chloroflexota bacterium]